MFTTATGRMFIKPLNETTIGELNIPMGPHSSCFVVSGEDLGEAADVVVNLNTGTVVWSAHQLRGSFARRIADAVATLVSLDEHGYSESTRDDG